MGGILRADHPPLIVRVADLYRTLQVQPCGSSFRPSAFGVWMVRSQAYAEPTFAVLMGASFDLVAGESALPKPHTEHLLCLRLLAGIVAPHLVLLVKRSRRRHDAFAHNAPIFNKRGEGVHLSTVLVRCLPHAFRFPESVLLPFEAAFDHPRQDAGELAAKLLGKLRILAITVESLCKRN